MKNKNDELYEIQVEFLQALQPRIDEIDRILLSGSNEEIADAKRQIHNLKGSSRMLGFDALGNCAAELEIAIAEGSAFSETLSEMKRCVKSLLSKP